ncbi:MULTISPECIES: SDR family NAD(P)-dependent oxidoreductase [Actinomadura]|uniref:SDR family NAD(P)-dependent oxidoreductase n=1 Tax=Actinomadura yumaensis TaxID=111807 RepID=A0ABW2CIX3_9ACTN|nr:SDR family NAD(P)-dependent oxidoreductase [Actinomadura sp. J1-007]
MRADDNPPTPANEPSSTSAPSMQGKTVLVTGSTSGIGNETARTLAALGAHVILTGRDPDRAADAVRRITSVGGRAEAITADLALQSGLRDLARRLAERHGRLDVLVNNAGGMAASRTLTSDGVERTFAVNVLAPYTLTCLLLPLLRAAPAARVVNLTGGIPGGPIDPAGLQAEKRFLGWTFSQYNHAKTAVLALTYDLADHLAATERANVNAAAGACAESAGVTVNVAYPGHAYTPGNRSLGFRAFPYAYRPLVPLLHLLGPRLMNDLSKAARTSVYLASEPALRDVTGAYFTTRLQRAPWPESVLDPGNRAAVWDLCQRLSGLTPS